MRSARALHRAASPPSSTWPSHALAAALVRAGSTPTTSSTRTAAPSTSPPSSRSSTGPRWASTTRRRPPASPSSSKASPLARPFLLRGQREAGRETGSRQSLPGMIDRQGTWPCRVATRTRGLEGGFLRCARRCGPRGPSRSRSAAWGHGTGATRSGPRRPGARVRHARRRERRPGHGPQSAGRSQICSRFAGGLRWRRTRATTRIAIGVGGSGVTGDCGDW